MLLIVNELNSPEKLELELEFPRVMSRSLSELELSCKEMAPTIVVAAVVGVAVEEETRGTPRVSSGSVLEESKPGTCSDNVTVPPIEISNRLGMLTLPSGM